MGIIHPYKLFIGGFVLVVIGFLVPFLTVIGAIESNLLLLFVSYGASVLGLFMGIVGVAYYFRPRD